MFREKSKWIPLASLGVTQTPTKIGFDFHRFRCRLLDLPEFCLNLPYFKQILLDFAIIYPILYSFQPNCSEIQQIPINSGETLDNIYIYIYIYTGMCEKRQKTALFRTFFILQEESQMRFTIDTELERIIVPDTFFNQIDKMNAVLEANGAADKKIDYVKYINDAIAKAQKNAPVRKADVKTLKK